MERITDFNSFKKILFWQRLIAFLLLISIVTAIFTFFYFFIDSYEYRRLFQTKSRFFYVGVLIGATCLIGLCLTCYLNWTLFRAGKYLKYYVGSGELKEWEESVKHQTTFWKLFTLSPFIATGLFLLMLVGAMSIYEIERDSIEPAIEPMVVDPIRVG